MNYEAYSRIPVCGGLREKSTGSMRGKGVVVAPHFLSHTFSATALCPQFSNSRQSFQCQATSQNVLISNSSLPITSLLCSHVCISVLCTMAPSLARFIVNLDHEYATNIATLRWRWPLVIIIMAPTYSHQFTHGGLPQVALTMSHKSVVLHVIAHVSPSSH
jgi:hypothetical protein